MIGLSIKRASRKASIIAFLVFFLSIASLYAVLQHIKTAEAVPGGAHALPYTYTNSEGGILTITSALDSTSPSNNLCNNGNRARPNFRVYLSDPGVILGSTESQLTYDLNIEWRECNKNTIKYAIYSPTYCPLAGHYGGNAPNYYAPDCVKYVGSGNNFNNATQSAPAEVQALGCQPGELAALNPVNKRGPSGNNPCTTPEFFTHNVYIKRTRPRSESPTTANGQVKRLNDLVLPKNSDESEPDKTITALGQDTKSSGSRTFAKDVCQYYAYDDDNNGVADPGTTANDCYTVTYTVRWTYATPPGPNWTASLGTDITFGGPPTSSNGILNPLHMYYSDTPTVYWNHYLRNNGPDTTNKNISMTAYQFSDGQADQGQGEEVSGYDGIIWGAGQGAGATYTLGGLSYTPNLATDIGQRVCQQVSIRPYRGADDAAAGSIAQCVRVHYFNITPTNSTSTGDFVSTPPGVRGTVSSAANSAVEGSHDAVWSAYRYSGRDVLTSGQLAARASSGQGPCGIGALQNPSYEYMDCRTTPTVNYDGTPSSQNINSPFSDFGFPGPHTLGTTFCFVLSVKDPTDSVHDNNSWRHSAATCTTSAKKPRVQFLGGDLRVGGAATSGIYLAEGRIYGSWTEYGMFSGGVNNFVNSGNGLRGSNTPSSALTFANTSNPVPGFGNYNPLPLTSQAYGYFTSLSGENNAPGSSPDSGVYNLSAAQNLGSMSVGANRDVIIRKTGPLRITENIIVDNDNVHSANRLSQVVIAADSIVIDDDVTRIDAWLLTPGTGSINTCEGSVNIRSNMCNKQLTVNGPINTRSLMLRRTAGANVVGSPADPDELREPSERFNLRPDAQLWAYTYANKADYAQIDYIEELPPRY
jgi:hypothetical protein